MASLAILCIMPHVMSLEKLSHEHATDSRTEAKRWIETHIPPGSMVATEAYGPPLVGPLDLSEKEPELRAALARRGYRRVVYAVLTVPSFQVVPRRSARFYQLPLYRDADAFVVSESVRSRYAAEPDTFSTPFAFYDSLPGASRFRRRSRRPAVDRRSPCTGTAGRTTASRIAPPRGRTPRSSVSAPRREARTSSTTAWARTTRRQRIAAGL